MKRTLFIVAFLFSLFGLGEAFAERAHNVSDTDKRKAEYIYMQAAVKLVEEDFSSFRDLIKRAYELDPQNKAISYQYGYSELLTQNQTRKNAIDGLRLMKKFVDAYPENFYENFIYAHACSQIAETDEAIRIWERLLREFPNRVTLYQLLSDGYAGNGEYDKAIAALDSIEKTEGPSNEVSIRKIGYLLAKKDTVSAISEGKRVLEVTNNGFFGNVLMGDIFMQLEKPDSSMVYYNKAQTIEPNNGYIFLSKANVARKLGDAEGYENEIKSAIVNKEVDVTTKLRILTSYIAKTIEDNDTTSSTIEMFNKVVEQHPHEAEVRKLYTDYLSYIKDYPGATEQLSFALDINPADDKGWKRLLWLLIYQKKYDECIATAEKALSYLPDDAEIYQILAVPYYSKEDYIKSNELLEKAIEKDKEVGALSLSEVYSSMAENYNQLGDKQKTYDYYEKAIELSPDNILAKNNYAYTLCVNGDNLGRAERLSKEVIDANSDNESYLDTYAWICFKMKDYKKALEYIEKTIEVTEEVSAVLYEHYGDILFMNGEPKKALEQWKKALELDPNSEMLKKKVKNKTYFYE